VGFTKILAEAVHKSVGGGGSGDEGDAATGDSSQGGVCECQVVL